MSFSLLAVLTNHCLAQSLSGKHPNIATSSRRTSSENSWRWSLSDEQSKNSNRWTYQAFNKDRVPLRESFSQMICYRAASVREAFKATLQTPFSGQIIKFISFQIAFQRPLFVFELIQFDVLNQNFSFKSDLSHLTWLVCVCGQVDAKLWVTSD